MKAMQFFIAVCAGLAWAGGAQAQISAPAAAASAPVRDALVQRGEYLARAGDCISCHTRPQGAPFAGGLPMATPFGTIISTNITPDKAQGIGDYSLEDFDKALRQGRAKDGHYLYPAMPYANFAQLHSSDVQALYAYFMHGVAAQQQDNPQTALKWPFSMRWLMAGWNLLYKPQQPYANDSAQSAEWNRGAYLVQGLGHCGACHTPRSVAGAEKAANEKEGTAFLSGTVIDGWYAQPLRNTLQPGLASWTVQDLTQYLQTGRNAHTAAFGPMAEVVGNSTQYLASDDLKAIATYLKSNGTPAPVSTPGPAAAPSKDTTAADLREGRTGQRGAMVFLNNCSACHNSNGQGARATFPALAQNSAVAAKDPTSLIRLVLQGSAMPHTTLAPSQLGMPGLGWRLTDDNVADVVSFIRNSWGNQAGGVTPQEVAKVRAAVAKNSS